MDEQEWKQWEQDAFVALTASKYTFHQAKIIVDWFSTIKGSGERDLVGDSFVDAFVGNYPKKHFSVYDTMMARLFVYAPFILAEYK